MDQVKYNEEVFNYAWEYLNKVVSLVPELGTASLDKYLHVDKKFTNMNDINARLISSIKNKQHWKNVIKFSRKYYVERYEIFKNVLYGFDPKEIIKNYNENTLLDKFAATFQFNKIISKKNTWVQFSKAVVSGSQFLSQFNDVTEFDTFIKNFSLNIDTRASLPMLLKEKIFGIGFALACDFLKELGYEYYPKPDVHLIDIFSALGLSENNDYSTYKAIIKMSDIVGKSAFYVDKVFWLIASGDFYLDRHEPSIKTIDLGGFKKDFIKTVLEKVKR